MPPPVEYAPVAPTNGEIRATLVVSPPSASSPLGFNLDIPSYRPLMMLAARRST